jgi:chromosome segregation ATPase
VERGRFPAFFRWPVEPTHLGLKPEATRLRPQGALQEKKEWSGGTRCGRLSCIEKTEGASVDQDLKAYLEQMEARMEARADERVGRLEARMDERFERVDERFERVDERFERMDERFERMDERFEKVETDGRQTRVLLEGMHDNIRMLAEGVMGVTERLEAFQAETAENFTEVKATLSPIYKNLNGRINNLDDQVLHLGNRYQNVDSRLRILEARADRQTEDVLESIRKKFGKSQA